MSRTRAARDPYWATALTRMTPAGQRLARGLWAMIRRSPALAPYLWIGSGWRTGSTEHVTGRALDVVATHNIGIRARTAEPKAWAAMNRLVNEVLVPNARALGIRHLIWDRKIYRTRYGKWGPLPGRTSKSSIGDWHEDHLHIWLDASGVGWLSRLDSTILKAATSAVAAAPIIDAVQAAAKEADMAITDKDAQKIAEAVANELLVANGVRRGGKLVPLIQEIADQGTTLTAINAKLDRAFKAGK